VATSLTENWKRTGTGKGELENWKNWILKGIIVGGLHLT